MCDGQDMDNMQQHNPGNLIQDTRAVLCAAVQRNDIELVQRLLATRTDPAAVPTVGQTSSTQDQINSSHASLLHAAGDPWNCMPLHVAAWAGHGGMAELLLSHGCRVSSLDDQQWTPLHLAAVRGNPDVAAVLLQHAAATNCRDAALRTPLHLVARRGHRCRGVNSSNGSNDLAVARLLLAHGANMAAVDAACRTPVHDAAFRGAADLLQLLMAAAGPTAACDISKMRDHQGCTPLECAAHRGHGSAVQLLLPHLPVDEQDSAGVIMAAVWAAVGSSYQQVATQLVKHMGSCCPQQLPELFKQPQASVSSSRSVLQSVVLQWVADCAGTPQRQRQLQDRRQQLQVQQTRLHQLLVGTAGWLRPLFDDGDGNGGSGNGW